MEQKTVNTFHLLTASVTAAGILAVPSSHAWERDDRVSNVPFCNGHPMQPQRPSTSLLSIFETGVRLKGEGLFKAFNKERLDQHAGNILQTYRGRIEKYGGVRDERYFLISIQPDVMVVAPFKFNLKYKTAEQMRGLAGNVTAEVFNPMYQQIIAQQRTTVRGDSRFEMMAELPGPNYAELGCAFPDLPNAVLWAPSISQQQIAFDDAARASLAKELGLTVQRHPVLNGYWQIAGCPA